VATAQAERLAARPLHLLSDAASVSLAAGRRPISIWQPGSVDGEAVFVRPEPGPFGDHFSSRRVIPVRRRRRHRLCLLGESTAAGYLLAPHLTPAAVLEQRLGGRWEVVDLARTNERLDSLADTAEASLQLAPDRLVVFAGNNWNLLETPEWSPCVPSSRARRDIADMLRRAGPTGPARAAAAALRRRVEAAFARLAALGVPLTVVVPEVNLADWQSPQPAGWLPADGVRRWYGLLASARRALAAGDLERARTRAVDLLQLDRGGVPTGLRLLSRISLALGDAESARTAARAEVDTVRYAAMAVLAAPQATATAQELLRAAAARHRFSLVDLPEHFGLVERLPGRRLFYDYCHLTPEGIDLAMTAVAEAIAGRPRDGPVEIAARARAAAELGAAIHGAHRGLEGDVVRHWLSRAVDTDPDAAEVLLDLVAARTSPVPAVLTPRQLRDPWLNHQQGWKWPHLDAEVIAAAGDVLGWERVRPRLGPPRAAPWNPVARFYAEAMGHEDLPPPLFLRAPWPWTEFAVIAGGPVELELVGRLPATAYPEGGTVELRLAGRRLERLELSDAWARHRLRIPARPGLERLSLAWPLPAVPGEAMLARAVERLEAGRRADLHPVFGELLDLRIRG
jgi:hypothetical protein